MPDLAAIISSPPSWVGVALSILGVTGIGAVILAIVKGKLYRRNTDAKAGKDEAEAESISTKTARDLMHDMREDIKELRKRIDDCEDDRKELHALHEASARSLAIANKRIASLEDFNAILLERLKRNNLSIDMEAT